MSQASGALSQVSVMARQPAVQRALPAIVLVTLLGIGFLAWMFLTEPARTALYPGMAEADKAQVVEVLVGNGIDAVIDTTTGDVEVPANDYYRARMLLASAGLPASVPAGSDMLNDLPMGASRSVEATRLRQAQEFDLARSISEISAVQSARVHLALPERSAFLRDNQPARASVFLQLAQGRALDQGQVEAIVNLVSSSVPGMAREDVTVVDQMGRLLSRGTDDAGLGMSERELQHRVQIESLYRSRIEAILAPIVGPENLSVQVTVDMDFTKTETTAEVLDPDGTVVLSEQESLSENTQIQARGIPGAISNTPPPQAANTPNAAANADAALAAATDTNAAAAAAPASTPGQSSRSSQTVRNYEVSRTVTATQTPGAKVTRVSAAILIAKTPTTEGEETTGPDLSGLEELARSAIGFDERRGDSVTIQAQEFRPMEIPSISPTRGMTWLPDVLRQIAVVVGLAIVGLGVVRPILDRVLVPASATMELANNLQAAAIEVGEGETLSDVQKRLNTRRRELTDSVIGANVSREDKFAAIRQLASDDPARIASVLHRMMADEIDQVS